MTSNERWLLRDVRVDGAATDCRLRDGAVVELGTALGAVEGETVVHGHGGALTVGLADHHLHLRAASAARRSLDLAGTGLPAAGPPGDHSWLRVIGAGVELTKRDVDGVWPERPVRVQHRSGALWTLNSAALAQLAPGASADETTTGQFWRAGARLRALLPFDTADDLTSLAAELASYGITHVTDATPELDARAAHIPQHLLSLSASGTGPRKLVLADHEPPDLAALTRAIRVAHGEGRGVALHVVSAPAMAVALAALTAAGSHGADRVEHAAVCSDDAALRLADLGVVVVTQPTIPARHGAAFVRDADPVDRTLLWRYGGLLRAGVGVCVSSDAPYGLLDPWRTVRAAATRSWSDAEDVAQERVPARVAFTSLTTSPSDPAGAARRVTVGVAADLALFDTDLDTALEHAVRGGDVRARATFVSGRLVHPGDGRTEI